MNRLVWALAGLHLVLALLYAWQTPYRAEGRLRFQAGAKIADYGAPDERQHANYIHHLATGQGFPVFNPKDENLYETYQSHQPPLYYLLATGWSKITGTPDVRAVDAKMKTRSLNAFIGAAGVIGAFFLGLWAFGRREVALGTAGFYALLPMNLALSGAVSNDPLLITLSTWVIALVVRGSQGWDWRSALLTGSLLGAALLTKSNAVALLLPALVGLAFGWKKTEKPGLVLVAALLPILFIAVPWFARNNSLYGDPLALKAFSEAFVGSAQAKDLIAALGPLGYWTGYNEAGVGVGWWTLRSLLGAFGYMDIFLPSALVGVFALLLMVGFAGWIKAKPEPEPEEKYDPRKVIPLIFGIIVLALFFRFNAQYFQAQARYLLPALGAISLCVSAGIAHWFKERAWWVMSAAFLILNLWILFGVLPGEFQVRAV